MPTYDLQGKVAIVTGAGSGKIQGINHAFAEALLGHGCSVVFADIALRPEAKATISAFPHPPPAFGGHSAVYYKMDQSDWSEIQGTWDFTLRTFGAVDVLCPDAGIWEPPSSSFWHAPGIPPLSVDDAHGRPGSYQTLAVNLLGPIRFAQIALAYWLRHPEVAGNLLLVASLSAYLPSIGTPLYNASKGGLVAFAQSLAQMQQQLGICVAVVCPATTYTPAVLHADYADKVREGDTNMTDAECARVMLDVATLARYGNGNVVEAMQFGKPGEASDVRVREVPYARLASEIDPSGDCSGKNIAVVEEGLWEQLKGLA
ncbi:hypothetical protein PG994_002312 [Apiospora phragmitis]|uniref:Uncharacterized protein n=1 Tax=Apiospora phragmitis TaxID=2905665 RepID=A0ABR1WVZ6_9PEZI